MCGIVGYVGKGEATEYLIKGLESLEYRGYDSSGIALHNGANLVLEKRAGRLAKLREALAKRPLEGHCGIGHTRWATHGAATDDNAHPFASEYGKFAVVHNGIITNYEEIAGFLRARGVRLRSETDSEVIAHLIDLYYTGDTLSAICRAVKDLEGSFALGILSVYEEKALFGVRKDSPLIVGRGEEESFICSDISGISEFCDEVSFLEDDTVVRVTAEGADAYDLSRGKRSLSFRKNRRAERGREGVFFGSHMLSEIREVPLSIKETLEAYPEEAVGRILRGEYDGIALLGCGSAYHAGLVFKTAMREIAGVLVRDCIASEYLTERQTEDERTLFIAVSQSGETADTLQAVRRAKKKGAKILAVCNAPESSLSRLADETVMTQCGVERAVAATKSYSAQAAVLLRICLQYADICGKIKKEESLRYHAELSRLAEKAEKVIGAEKALEEIAESLALGDALFCLGRGADHCAAKEASLKIKEVSYLFSEAYPSGELKHGTLALMTKGVFALFFSTDPVLAEKNAASVEEVRCRGAQAVVLAAESAAKAIRTERIFLLPDTIPVFSPVVSSVAAQLIAYFVAVKRGCDVDRPRNLAKSVTVE
ncbi:MAG: glutamine--fructose-6-phosphate transaminase (isomerizing) [Clostridia bacterium]|nr:glutamine--fructose-6-phosphate transaminase (isomerizing) [Clostridia bacterium]